MAADISSLILAFEKDCHDLIAAFTSHHSEEFQYFVTEWRRLNFHYIFYGYPCMQELVQFIQSALLVVKSILLKANSQLERIGSIYLLYSMYFKQPPREYCKIRVMYNEWMVIKNFFETVDVPQVKLVIWKLVESNAFSYCAYHQELGLEKFVQKGIDSQKINATKPFNKFSTYIEPNIAKLTDEDTGMLSGLDILQVAYNEMKENVHIAGPSWQRSQLLPPTTIASELLTGIEKIENYFKPTLLRDITDDSDDSSTDGNEQNDDQRVEKDIGVERSKIKQKAFLVDGKSKEKQILNPESSKKVIIIDDEKDVIQLKPKRTSTRKKIIKPTYRDEVESVVNDSSPQIVVIKVKKSKKVPATDTETVEENLDKSLPELI